MANFHMPVDAVRFLDRDRDAAVLGVRAHGVLGGRERFSLRGKDIRVGDWVVTRPDGSTEIVPDDEFFALYRPL